MSPRFLPMLLALTLAGLMLTLTGCGGSTSNDSSPGRVAVVDMDHIAQAIGFSQRVGQMLQQMQQEEEAQLRALQQQLGLTPTATMPADAAQAQKLAQWRNALEHAQQKLEMVRFNEMQQFRNAVRPVAQRVAQARGCTIVMEMRDGILSVDMASDITDEVIAELPRMGAPAASPSGPSSPVPFPQAGQPPIAPASPAGSIPSQFLPKKESTDTPATQSTAQP